jgi:hypothetical protein
MFGLLRFGGKGTYAQLEEGMWELALEKAQSDDTKLFAI